MFWSDTENDISNLKEMPRRTPHEYNQLEFPEYGKNLCTVYSAMGAFTDSTGHIIGEELRKEIVKEAIKQWLDPDFGRYLHKAIDLVRNFMKSQGIQVQTFRIKNNTSELTQVLNKNYPVVTGYGGNKAYNEDKRSKPVAYEWYILNGSDFWEPTYHHAIRIEESGKYNERFVVDNYETPYRIYELEKFKEVLKTHYFNYSYIFVPMSQPKFKDVDENTPFYKSIKKASDLGIIKGFEDGTFRPNEPLTRGQFVAILDRLWELKK